MDYLKFLQFARGLCRSGDPLYKFYDRLICYRLEMEQYYKSVTEYLYDQAEATYKHSL